MTNQADDIYEAGKRIMKERHNALKEKSKPLKDLVVSEIFEVLMVNQYTENMIVSHFDYHTPIGAIPTSEAGCKSKIIIKVKPLSRDPKNIIDTLLFDGFAHIVGENYITAKIPRYEEKISLLATSLIRPNIDDYLFFDRAFKKEERAIELILLGKLMNPIAEYRSADYAKYI